MLWLHQKTKPAVQEHEKRICARCEKQILRRHKWSRKMWDDRKARHLDCAHPAGEKGETNGAESLPEIL